MKIADRGNATIVHLPAWNDLYQRSLVAALQSLGVRTRLGAGSRKLGLDVSVPVNVIREWKPCVIHLHWQHSFLVGKGVVATMAKSAFFILQLLCVRALGIRIVWTIHNLKNHENRHVRWELFFCRYVAKVAHTIIVHCEAARRLVERHYGVASGSPKIRVIPHGSDIGKPVERHSARSALGLGGGEFVFLFMGLLRPYKGVGALLDAFSKLPDPNCRLLIAGKCPDPELAKLTSRAAERDSRVRLRLEFVPDDFVATLMSAADVVVCPYQDILTAGSVIRAMSYSRPVITPRLGCLPETVPPAEGLSFDADAPDGLLKAMRYALGAGPASLASVAERNLESCKALAWDRVARATVTAYGLEPAS